MTKKSKNPSQILKIMDGEIQGIEYALVNQTVDQRSSFTIMTFIPIVF